MDADGAIVNRSITVHGVTPNHRGRGEPSYIELVLILDYLKGAPMESIVISPTKALRLIEELALALRATAVARTPKP